MFAVGVVGVVVGVELNAVECFSGGVGRSFKQIPVGSFGGFQFWATVHIKVFNQWLEGEFVNGVMKLVPDTESSDHVV